jgi:dihydroorotase
MKTIEDSYNLRRVSPRLTTSGIVPAEGLKALASQGYEVVINLLPDSSEKAIPNERGIIESQGIEYIYIPVDFEQPSPLDFQKFAEALDGIRKKKTHIHCAANYRVSAFYALYQAQRNHWSVDRAMEFIQGVWQPADHPGWSELMADTLATVETEVRFYRKPEMDHSNICRRRGKMSRRTSGLQSKKTRGGSDMRRELRSGLLDSSDILLKNGHVIDGSQSIDAPRDVLIQGGRVARVEEAISPSAGCRVIDVSDCIVTPGLIDMHTHLFHTAGNPDAWAGEYGVDPDAFSFRSGVTTMVDTGSAGWRNFDFFRTTVIDRVHTRVFALVNIASYGMISEMVEQHPADFSPERCVETARRHAEVVVGFKTAHYARPDWISVDRVLEAGKLAELPVMVDFGYFQKERPYWELVCEKLRPGDISTHCYRGPVPVVDEDGRVYDYLHYARERGVVFDLGQGAGSLLFRNAVPAVAQGFPPDTISTDLHVLSMNRRMIDLPTTMSKFLAMGMPVPEIIRRTTTIPASVIGKPDLGTLKPGSVADVAVWKIENGNFGFSDSAGGRLPGSRRFFCEATLRAGEVVWDFNARFERDYRELPKDCGIRSGLEFLVPPPPGYPALPKNFDA